jgi:hypothetical protein
MKTRKPRSDAWHAGLTVQQQARAFEQCTKLGLVEAAAVIARECGLSRTPSPTALSNWWSEWPLRKAFLDFGNVAEAAKQMLRDTPSLDLDTDQIEAVGQAVFTAAAVQARDPEAFATVRKLRQKDAEIALDRDRFELLKRKADQAEQAEGVTRSDLTPEAKQSRYREIFGLA